MNLHANLTALYNETAADDPYHLAAGALLRNLPAIADRTAAEAADICHVSKSTLERLVHRLGYDGFVSFRGDAARIVAKFGLFNRVLPEAPGRGDRETADAYFAEVQATLDAQRSALDFAEVRRVVEALRTARRVVFYTMGRSFAESALQFTLAMAGKDAQVVSRYADQLADAQRLDAGCVAFVETTDFMSTFDMAPVFEAARRGGAKTVLLTLTAASQYADLADLRLASRQTDTMVGDYGLQWAIDVVHLVFRREAIDRR